MEHLLKVKSIQTHLCKMPVSLLLMLRYINKLSKIETSGRLILDVQLKTSKIVLNNINFSSKKYLNIL